MNKYALIIAAMVTFGGVSGLFSKDNLNNEESKESSANPEMKNAESSDGRVVRVGKFLRDKVENAGEYIVDFSKEIIVENPKKLAAAGAIKLWHLMNQKEYLKFSVEHMYEWNGTKNSYGLSSLNGSIKSTRFPLMLVGYSVGNTIYNRLKK